MLSYWVQQPKKRYSTVRVTKDTPATSNELAKTGIEKARREEAKTGKGYLRECYAWLLQLVVKEIDPELNRV